LVPQGQFGTRLEGGKDSASPRYIHTYLQSYVSNLVPSDDFDCLTYRDDDGTPVEPEWYAPVLPMILVNGCSGIGTGYSTEIPQFNPKQLKTMIIEWLQNDKELSAELVPYYKGFKGTIVKSDKDYIVKGVWKTEKNEMTITELPIGTWTSKFREKLDKLVSDGLIKDYSDTSTDTDVHVKVKLDKSAEPVEKLLTDKIRFTNMHAFNSKCVIQKYDTPNEILFEYAKIRLNLYCKRKDNLLTNLRNKLPYHENVVRFIKQQCESAPRPDLRRKTPEECEKLLVDNKFDKIKESFDYLLDLPIKSLTLKNAQKHEKDLEDLKKKIQEIEGTTPKQMWLHDLQVLMI
jgi:DNA topoisomerase-2